MLDPATAFSVAAGAVEFINFSAKIIKLGREYRKAHGQLPGDLARVELLVEDLLPMVQRIQQLPTEHKALASSLSGESFESLIAGCLEDVQKLFDLLQSLKINGNSNGLSSMLAALRAMRKSGKVADLEQSLERYRSAIAARLGQSTHENQRYICELLDRNRTESSQSSANLQETLNLLASSINHTTTRIEEDVNALMTNDDRDRLLVERLLQEIKIMQRNVQTLSAKTDNNQRSMQLMKSQAILQLQSAARRKRPRTRSHDGRLQRQKASAPTTNASRLSELDQHDMKSREPSVNFTISVAIYGTPKDLVDLARNLLFTSWSSVISTTSQMLSYSFTITPILQLPAASRLDQITSLIQPQARRVQANYDVTSKTLTASNGQSSASIILQMDIGLQESLGYEGFVNPSFYGFMGPHGLLPRLPPPPPQLLTESPPLNSEPSLEDLLQHPHEIETGNVDSSIQNLTIDHDSLLLDFDGPSDTAQLGNEIVAARDQNSEIFPSMPAQDLDFSTAPNVLPQPAESSIFLKEHIMKRMHSHSRSISEPKSVSGWQRVRRNFKILFWLSFWLSLFFFFGRWIDGGVLWSPAMNDAAYWRDQIYGVQAEHYFLYHKNENLQEKAREEAAMLREGRIQEERKQREARMRGKAYRCHERGTCTKYYWEKAKEKATGNPRKNSR